MTDAPPTETPADPASEDAGPPAREYTPGEEGALEDRFRNEKAAPAEEPPNEGE